MSKFLGFLLSYYKYGDNDAILHCFTLESGFQSFFLKGIYFPKNKKKAYLSPLNELEITINEGHKNTNLLTVKKIEISKANDFNFDIKAASVAFFVSEFLHQIVKNESQNALLYHEIRKLSLLLSKKNYTAHYCFLIKILEGFGINPSISEGAFFNIEKAEFQNASANNLLDLEVSSLWKKILIGDYQGLIIKKESRKKLLDSILLFYKFHFPDFHTPKSLPILLQILE